MSSTVMTNGLCPGAPLLYFVLRDLAYETAGPLRQAPSRCAPRDGQACGSGSTSWETPE